MRGPGQRGRRSQILASRDEQVGQKERRRTRILCAAAPSGAGVGEVGVQPGDQRLGTLPGQRHPATCPEPMFERGLEHDKLAHLEGGTGGSVPANGRRGWLVSAPALTSGCARGWSVRVTRAVAPLRDAPAAVRVTRAVADLRPAPPDSRRVNCNQTKRPPKPWGSFRLSG